MKRLFHNAIVWAAFASLMIVSSVGCNPNPQESDLDKLQLDLEKQQVDLRRSLSKTKDLIENSREILKGRFANIRSIRLNPDRTVATIVRAEGGLNLETGLQTIVVDLSDHGRELARFDREFPLTCVSPDKQRIAVIQSFQKNRRVEQHSSLLGEHVSFDEDFDLRVYDLADQTWIWTSDRTSRRIHGLAYSSDGSAILTTQEPSHGDTDHSKNEKKNIEFVWLDAETGELLRNIPGPRVELPDANLAFGSGTVISSDAQWAAMWKPNSSNSEVLVCDTTTGEVKHRLKQLNGFNVVAFSLDGKSLATAGRILLPEPTSQLEAYEGLQTEIKVWDLASGAAKVKTECGTTSFLEFSPDGRRLILEEVVFTKAPLQSDVVVIDTQTATEVLRLPQVGYSPKFGFLSNEEIFATVLSRETDGIQEEVLGRLFVWKLPASTE